MEERARIHLLQMRDAASSALSFVAGISEDQFMQDQRTQQAVCLSLILIGENVIKLQDQYPTALQTFSGTELQQIRGMRNRLVHAYVEANLQIVWTTVVDVLPRLVKQVDELAG